MFQSTLLKHKSIHSLSSNPAEGSWWYLKIDDLNYQRGLSSHQVCLWRIPFTCIMSATPTRLYSFLCWMLKVCTSCSIKELTNTVTITGRGDQNSENKKKCTILFLKTFASLSYNSFNTVWLSLVQELAVVMLAVM